MAILHMVLDAVFKKYIKVKHDDIYIFCMGNEAQ